MLFHRWSLWDQALLTYHGNWPTFPDFAPFLVSCFLLPHFAFLEAGKSKIKALVNPVPGEDSWFADSCLLAVFSFGLRFRHL